MAILLGLIGWTAAAQELPPQQPETRLSSSATASAPPSERSWRSPPMSDRSGAFVWENDIFGGTDRNYTNGVLLEVTSRPGEQLPLTGLLARFAPRRFQPESGMWRTGLTLGHEIYTPRDITLDNPDPNDRPYAGFAHVTASLHAVRNYRLESLSLTAGVVGDGAGAEFVQTNFHNFIDGEDPRGYDFQIKTEPVINLRVARQQRTPPTQFAGLEWDAALHGGSSLGNANISANFGGGVRFGRNLAGDFGPPRPAPALSGVSFYDTPRTFGWYVFADTGARFVLRDIFLDGNTFQDSRSVDRDPFVWDMQGGVAVSYGPVRVTFSYIQRSEQFDNQNGVARFGSGAISFKF